MKRLSLKNLKISSNRNDSSNDANLSREETATSEACPSANSSHSTAAAPAVAVTVTELTEDDGEQGEPHAGRVRNSCTVDHVHGGGRASSGIFNTFNTLRRKLNIRSNKSNRHLGKIGHVSSGSADNVNCENNCMQSSSPPRHRHRLRWLRNGGKSSQNGDSDRTMRAARSDNVLHSSSPDYTGASGPCRKCCGKRLSSPGSKHASRANESPRKRAAGNASSQLVLVDTEYGHASAPVAEQPVPPAQTGRDQLTLHSGELANWDLQRYGTGPLETALQALQPVYDQVRGGGGAGGRSGDGSWSLTRELVKLSHFGWYWGPITRVEAEEKLSGQADGAFLVRDSSDQRYLLSLSFRSYSHTLHTRIEHCNGVFSFYSQSESDGYGAIVDLIEHSMSDSRAGVFCYSRARMPGAPSFPVRLTRPVSRFAQVRTLQYLCRFVIRQYTRLDHIQRLPLPGSIKGWLEENQY